MKPGLFQILIIVLIIVLLFGRGRISELLGDLGRGVKNFRRNLDDQGSGEIPAGQSEQSINGGVAKAVDDPAKSG